MGDLRHAVKTFRRRPGFAFSAALLLALGVGANTAVFGVGIAIHKSDGFHSLILFSTIPDRLLLSPP